MSIRLTTAALLTGAALLTITPAHAGGPVIVEETETAAPARDGKALPFVIVAAALLIAIASQSGSCFAEDPAPAPQPGGC